MMQMILTAIAEGNLRMGTETMEHNSELKNAMNRVCRLGEELSNTLNDSEKELLEKLEDSYAEAIQSDSQQSFINGPESVKLSCFLQELLRIDVIHCFASNSSTQFLFVA